MRPGIDPKVDYAFKRLFGSEETTDLLIHVLNAVMSPPAGREVAEVALHNPFNEKDTEEAKLSVLDIKARDAQGRWFNVEMQMAALPTYPQRVLYYWAELYTGQLAEGQDFDQLRPAVSISFLNNVRLRDGAYHHLFGLRDEGGQVVLTDDLAIHMIELPKFTLAAEALTTPLEVWCYFLSHGAELDTAALPKTLDIPPIRQALEVLTIMSQTTTERELYEARLKARRDRADEMRGAVDQGELIGRILLSQDLLGVPLTAREELSDKPIEELIELATELQQKVKSRPA